MAQNKEQLNKLLLFIKQLVEEPGNEEFVNGLRNLLAVPVHNSADNKKLSDIEKYLGLDYRLDSAIPDIDYSFIRNDYVKNQLVSDYREMLRYRYGVRAHKIDFSEFCRYAMLQVEQMLNYYYQNKFSSIEEIRIYINNRVRWANIEKVDSIKSLQLYFKLLAFLYKEKIWKTLDCARKVRNEQSHRSADEELSEINEFRMKLQKLKFPLKKDGEVSYNKIKKDPLLLKSFEDIEDTPEYKKYCYQLWHLREPFDEVMEAIREFSGKMAIELGTKS